MERGVERIGTTIRGKYRIDSVIGVGGMAVVYAATHRNKKRFAIKMLHPEISVVSAIRDRFLREGYVANTVDHPGAVAVLDEDVAEDGAAFLVMELLQGAPVDAIWEARGKRLPLSAVLAIMVQFLDVLKAAHAKSIVHRDLKPANLFLTRDGIVKVLDFGIARLRDASTSSGSTQSGAMMGTPAYLPPEQAGGRTREIDGQTDLWAVGATMFALLSGEMVHEGENAPQVVIASATKPARSLATVWPEAPPLVVDLVARALAFDKSERWPNAAAMQNAVRSTYRALFNADVTSERLVDLVPGGARTSDSPSFEPFQASATELMAPTPPQTPAPVLPAASPMSTNAPVSATGTLTRVRTPSLVIAAVVGVACIGIGVGAFVRYRNHQIKEEPAAIITSAAPTTPPSAEGSPASIASTAIEPTPTPTPTPSVPGASASVMIAATPSTHATVLKPAVKPSATASAKPVNCDPPYTVDPQNGKHIYKKECL